MKVNPFFSPSDPRHVSLHRRLYHWIGTSCPRCIRPIRTFAAELSTELPHHQSNFAVVCFFWIAHLFLKCLISVLVDFWFPAVASLPLRHLRSDALGINPPSGNPGWWFLSRMGENGSIHQDFNQLWTHFHNWQWKQSEWSIQPRVALHVFSDVFFVWFLFGLVCIWTICIYIYISSYLVAPTYGC